MENSLISETVDLMEIQPGVRVSVAALKQWLPDMEHALWFAKVYDMTYDKLSTLLYTLFQGSVLDALAAGNHSTSLQDYIVSVVPEHVIDKSNTTFVQKPMPGQVLPDLWRAAHVEIANSIKEVASKLSRTLHMLPSKQGSMLFGTMMKMNKQRNSLGVHRAYVAHERVPDVLVILDVSGSMSESTIRTIIGDVVAMSWEANAHLATVSNQTHYWEPGSYDVNSVLKEAAYGGTHYETLAPLFQRDWGTVVCIADYDSSIDAKRVIEKCKGRVGEVLDFSLVPSTTFLGECVAQLAESFRPVLISKSHD